MLKMRKAQIAQNLASKSSNYDESKHVFTPWKGTSPCPCKTF